MSMAVEDEVEVMDDSEDELIVNRSNYSNYSRGESKTHLFKMNSEDLEDDTEEELSLLYEDDENDIKEEEIKPNIGELNGKKQLGCGELVKISPDKISKPNTKELYLGFINCIYCLMKEQVVNLVKDLEQSHKTKFQIVFLAAN